MKTVDFLSLLKGVRAGHNGEYITLCPGHHDTQPSLSIKEVDGKILVKCFAGCQLEDILKPLGLEPRDLFLDSNQIKGVVFDGWPPTSYKGLPVTRTYEYTHADSSPAYIVQRTASKDFPVYHLKGGKPCSGYGGPRILYRLPELIAADPDEPVYIPAGEKDADNLRAQGLVATTSPGGEGKGQWAKVDAEPLRGRKVAILPDNDQTGHIHALEKAHALSAMGCQVKVLELSGLGEREDISDWLEVGHTKDELIQLVKTAPLFKGELDRPLLVDLEGMEVKEVDWLWERRIPKGFVSLVTGDPDAGKTYVVLDLAATISEGGEFPDGSPTSRGRVLYVDGENGLEELKRRLLARDFQGWGNLRILSEVSIGGENQPLDIDKHLQQLHDALRDFKPDWVIFDPLVAFHERNEIVATEVRGLIRLLFTLAQQYDCAITVIQHPNKTYLAPELYRVRGSLDFVAAVRAMLRVEVLKERDDGARALVVDKLNLAAKPPPLAFTIEDRAVKWLGEVSLGKPESAFSEARRFLVDILSTGPQQSAYLEELVAAEGMSWSTIKRAKRDLGIKAHKVGHDHWVWELPQQPSSIVGLLDPLPYKTEEPLVSFPSHTTARGQTEEDQAAAIVSSPKPSSKQESAGRGSSGLPVHMEEDQEDQDNRVAGDTLEV